ncbi:MAG: molybdenum cofactor guanylyltransferase [Arcticibacter sp.]
MMLGVVLCGGESRRMGRDKGLLSAGSEAWAERAAFKLQMLGIPVLISINTSQIESYSLVFQSDQLIIDSVVAKGPLRGLFSVHEEHPLEDLLLLACDMVDMDVATLQRLKESYVAKPWEFDYYTYEREGFIEPLCAIYPARTLRLLRKRLQEGTLTQFSLQRLISQSNYMGIPVEDSRKFENYNSVNPFA